MIINTKGKLFEPNIEIFDRTRQPEQILRFCTGSTGLDKKNAQLTKDFNYVTNSVLVKTKFALDIPQDFSMKKKVLEEL
jgi:hypothetical protein